MQQTSTDIGGNTRPTAFLKGKLRGIIVTVQKIKISSIIYKHSTKTEKKTMHAKKEGKEKKKRTEVFKWRVPTKI